MQFFKALNSNWKLSKLQYYEDKKVWELLGFFLSQCSERNQSFKQILMKFHLAQEIE
jgi:hypothetical protein